ncbi:MAG: ribosome silencing factor, partial [Candidatus Latescibacteria bacterium]|nr:ribosome silencing factor [Candidatus Latescibacterota bacterium]
MITSSQTLVESSLECLRSKKAEEIVVMNLSKASDIADYFIVCTGGSDLHVRAIADAVVEGLEEQGVHVWHVEGYEGGRWVLIDLVDVVVHIFQAVTR